MTNNIFDFKQHFFFYSKNVFSVTCHYASYILDIILRCFIHTFINIFYPFNKEIPFSFPLIFVPCVIFTLIITS